MNNKITISVEGVNISIESAENIKKPKNASFDMSKLIGVTNLFKEFLHTSKYSNDDLSKLEESLNFKLGPKTKKMLLEVGYLKMEGFEVPNSTGIISLTNKWKSSVATKDQINKFIVIEADGPDYTLIDNKDMIFVYDGKKKVTESYDEDVITHITKHIMAKIVGDEYEY